jgi:KDO2-lipid IV(A) lauroyltransferase
VPAPGRLNVRVRAATQIVADQFAGYIASHPADWHMLQRFWTADLDERPGRAITTERADGSSRSAGSIESTFSRLATPTPRALDPTEPGDTVQSVQSVRSVQSVKDGD